MSTALDERPKVTDGATSEESVHLVCMSCYPVRPRGRARTMCGELFAWDNAVRSFDRDVCDLCFLAKDFHHQGSCREVSI